MSCFLSNINAVGAAASVFKLIMCKVIFKAYTHRNKPFSKWPNPRFSWMLNFMLADLTLSCRGKDLRLKICFVIRNCPPTRMYSSIDSLGKKCFCFWVGIFGGLGAVVVKIDHQRFFSPINNCQFWMASRKATGYFISSY